MKRHTDSTRRQHPNQQVTTVATFTITSSHRKPVELVSVLVKKGSTIPALGSWVNVPFGSTVLEIDPVEGCWLLLRFGLVMGVSARGELYPHEDVGQVP